MIQKTFLLHILLILLTSKLPHIHSYRTGDTVPLTLHIPSTTTSSTTSTSSTKIEAKRNQMPIFGINSQSSTINLEDLIITTILTQHNSVTMSMTDLLRNNNNNDDGEGLVPNRLSLSLTFGGYSSWMLSSSSSFSIPWLDVRDMKISTKGTNKSKMGKKLDVLEIIFRYTKSKRRSGTTRPGMIRSVQVGELTYVNVDPLDPNMDDDDAVQEHNYHGASFRIKYVWVEDDHGVNAVVGGYGRVVMMLVVVIYSMYVLWDSCIGNNSILFDEDDGGGGERRNQGRKSSGGDYTKGEVGRDRIDDLGQYSIYSDSSYPGPAGGGGSASGAMPKWQ